MCKLYENKYVLAMYIYEKEIRCNMSDYTMFKITHVLKVQKLRVSQMLLREIIYNFFDVAYFNTHPTEMT